MQDVAKVETIFEQHQSLVKVILRWMQRFRGASSMLYPLVTPAVEQDYYNYYNCDVLTN